MTHSMHSLGQEQGVPVIPAWPSPEDYVMPGSYGEEPLLIPLASEGLQPSSPAQERTVSATSRLAYVVFVVFAMAAAGILGSVLTLAAFPPQGSPAQPTSATQPTLMMPTQEITALPPVIIINPGTASNNDDISTTSTSPTTFTASATSTASASSTTTSSTATTPRVVERQVKVFTRGKHYYRSAYLDEAGGRLFVGAMDHLFKLQLDDISRMPVMELLLPAPQSSVNSCTMLGGGPLGPQVECRNHIRVIQPIGNGSTLYVCGTNSRDPTDWQVRAMDLSLIPVAEQVPIMESNMTGRAEGRCSYFVSQDATSLWLDDAPEKNSSCVVSLWPLKRGGHAIYRAAIPQPGTNTALHNYLLTDTTNTAVLNEPRTVGALSMGAHAYFIFREDQVERRACGGRVASAMARVCKNDLGGDPGERVRRQQWTSYMKVRLRCTDFSRSPGDTAKANFTFDEIHGSSWVPELENGVLFGTFVTVTNGYPDSAVCAFRREDIERAFNGTTFIRLASSRDSISTAVRANSTTYPGIGSTCVPDSRTLSRADTDFLFSHPLLAEPPRLRHDRTFFTLQGAAFRSTAAFLLSEAWGSWVVCYVATATGLVVKLAQEVVTGNTAPTRAHLVDAFNVTTDRIWKLLASVQHRSLYVFSDTDVRQYRMDDCAVHHQHCATCVMDPFCGWDGTQCLPHAAGASATTRRTC
ncbi:semaphorin-2A-like [Amblyomma americanum]